MSIIQILIKILVEHLPQPQVITGNLTEDVIHSHTGDPVVKASPFSKLILVNSDPADYT